jgi:hypothetical protein
MLLPGFNAPFELLADALCIPFWKLTYRNENGSPDRRSISAT